MKYALGCLGVLVLLAIIVFATVGGSYNRLVTLDQEVNKGLPLSRPSPGTVDL